MKYALYTLFITLSFLSSNFAQITIDSGVFPVMGDVLRTSNASNLEGVTMTSGGDDQYWDFSTLQTNLVNEVMFSDPSTGVNAAFFPEANLMIQTDQGENFFKTSAQMFEFLGFSGGDPTGFGIDLVAVLDPALIEARAPVNYLDLNTYGSETNIPFSADAIPGGLLDSLPIAPDSLRIRVIVDRTDLVDAWGTVKIPGGQEYEVLRQKRFELTETRLDIKIGVFPWVDVTDQLGDMGFFGGIDTLVSYTFMSNDSKENIAVFELDGEEQFVIGAEFKTTGEPNSVQVSISSDPDLFAYPNPAINEVKFEFKNLANGNYKLKIFNILGLETLSEEYYVSGNKTVKTDISRLKKGTYLYSLLDESGKTLTTKRLIVVRP